jgi:hypothetical protein
MRRGGSEEADELRTLGSADLALVAGLTGVHPHTPRHFYGFALTAHYTRPAGRRFEVVWR